MEALQVVRKRIGASQVVTLEDPLGGSRQRTDRGGHVTQEELDALYSISEIVLTSSNIEGFKLTAVEGWLRKKPCIVSSGAGVSELVHNALNGYIFESSDDLDLSRKLQKVLSSSETSAKLGENGYSTSSEFSVSEAVKSTRAIFDEVSKTYSSFRKTKSKELVVSE